jgi:non-specific serine/threonine protein kinase
MATTFSTNLPLQLTSFIGREREIAEIKRLFQATRLLTLTGSGGAGKTRLAIQVAADVCDSFANAVWFVDIAPLTDPALLPQTVATVFGLQDQGGRPIAEVLREYLREKQLLLLLDNCEHLIDACAHFADDVLRAASHVTILATSREALNIAGETTFHVPSLTLPDIENLPPLESIAQSEAVQLFVARARAVRSTFALTKQNAPAVTQICHWLDGMPLAVELAAVRVKALSVDEIAARLDDRFNLLTLGKRTALPRHQTLRALIDWSFDLLSGDERVLFRRVAVFAGGWTLGAAEAICSGQGIKQQHILDLLTHLVDKSLVQVEEREGKARYHMLETIRQYASAKLAESGEQAHIRDNHLAFFLKLGRSESLLWDAEPRSTFDRLETEHNNLRAALTWSLENQQTETGSRLASVLWWFWRSRSYLSEGSAWLRRLLDSTQTYPVPADVRAKVLEAAAGLAWRQGNIEQATALSQENLDLCRTLGDKHGMAFSLGTLGRVAWLGGDYAKAWTCHEQALVLRREMDNRSGMSYSLGHLAEVAWGEGNLTQAKELCIEALALLRRVHPQWHLGELLNKLGTVARSQGDYVLARSSFDESLADQRDLGDRWDIAYSLEGIACIAAAEGRPEGAVLLWGFAEALRETINAPLPPAYSANYAPIISHSRTQLGVETFARAWADGRKMSVNQAIDYALAERTPSDESTIPSKAGKRKFGGLTARERQVAALIAQGRSNRAIAEELVIGVKTVEAHITRILDKLGFESRTQIAGWAISKGLADAPQDLDTQVRES